MANITLPERFQSKIVIDQEIDGIVKTTLHPFGEILTQSNLFFFGEYTDHGIKHIENVLSSTDNLIPEETYNNTLTHDDIGYYILAVILHDIGMHINLDGINSLLNGDFDDVRIENIDKKTWKELWNEFMSEAYKFSGKELNSIFGDYYTIVREPVLSDYGNITENDKKLIGEFIRRHHPRLAHEIALKGFPGKAIIPFAENLELKKRNLIGLIARSHGLDLRKSIDILEEEYDKHSRRIPEGVHASYLMVLLRISDYIQIDKSRTSKTIIRVKTFSSPISVLEHSAHLSIENVDLKYQDDPEKIHVSASPEDSIMYLKLKKLLSNIQYEFDISWAVLGELYGFFADEDRPKIKYRRISSNLVEKSFIDKQNYIADNFQFKTNDDIIKLLVAPLYGDDVSYGVRELLQNSIDATKEREVIEIKEENEYHPEITVSIDEQNDFFNFKIIDNGLGMNLEVLKNYFLSAGASYRKSSDWQKQFVDNDSNTVVRRSGRFGVGLLSAFLIGKEIEVKTRKKGNQEGYKFKANLNTELINIIKDTNIEVGTEINIRISIDKIDDFDNRNYYRNIQWFQWYTLAIPKINYIINKNKLSNYKVFNPEPFAELPKDYYSFNSEGYNKILWTYSENYINKDLTCNGIIIPNNNYTDRKNINAGILKRLPKINIFDNNGLLPLTLDRNTISGKVSFNDDLLIDIYKDFIAYFLVFEQTNYFNGNKIFTKEKCLNYPGTNYQSYEYVENYYGHQRYTSNNSNYLIDAILISKKGFIINYNYFVKKLENIKAILIQHDYNNDFIELDIDDRFIFLTDHKINSIPDYINAIEPKTWNTEIHEFDKYNSRIFMKTEKYNFLFDSNKKRVSQYLKLKCENINKKNSFTTFEMDNPIKTIISDEFLKKYDKKIHFIREYEINCIDDGDKIFDALLEKYIGEDVIIPYSIEERKKKFPLAFEELEGYMKRHIV